MSRPFHLVLATCSLLVSAQAGAADTPRSVWDGAYNAAQVKRGTAGYVKLCETCHGPKLEGSEGPPLAGAEFLANWSGYSTGDLLEKMRSTMPQTDPGSLSIQQYVDLLAFILSANKFPAGDAELPIVADRLKQIRFDAAK
jgi:mono/diheme cytochrome c family protein